MSLFINKIQIQFKSAVEAHLLRNYPSWNEHDQTMPSKENGRGELSQAYQQQEAVRAMSYLTLTISSNFMNHNLSVRGNEPEFAKILK